MLNVVLPKELTLFFSFNLYGKIGSKLCTLSGKLRVIFAMSPLSGFYKSTQKKHNGASKLKLKKHQLTESHYTECNYAVCRGA